MKVQIPAPPQSSFDRAQPSTPLPTSRRVKLSEPLDVGFLNRTHITSLWVGALAAMMAYGQTRSLLITFSLIAGIALGALLLKSQEIFVRQALSSAAARSAGKLARWPLMILQGVKFAIIMTVLGIAIGANWLQPGALVLGFFTQQLIVVAKVTGRFLSLKLRSADSK